MKKKLNFISKLSLVILLIALTSTMGISYINSNTKVQNRVKGGLTVDSIFITGIRDTVFPADFPVDLRTKGALVYRSTDNTLYFYNGTRWLSIKDASSSSGPTSYLYPTASLSTTATVIRDASATASGLSLATDGIYSTGRLHTAQGANINSATNLTLGNDGNTFSITTVATTINNIVATGWSNGDEVVLFFNGNITVKNNTGGGGGTKLNLAGAADFSATANDVLTLMYINTAWYEKSRSVN